MPPFAVYERNYLFLIYEICSTETASYSLFLRYVTLDKILGKKDK